MTQYVTTTEYRKDLAVLKKFAVEANEIALAANSPELTVEIFKILWARRLEMDILELDIPEWMKGDFSP